MVYTTHLIIDIIVNCWNWFTHFPTTFLRRFQNFIPPSVVFCHRRHRCHRRHGSGGCPVRTWSATSQGTSDDDLGKPMWGHRPEKNWGLIYVYGHRQNYGKKNVQLRQAAPASDFSIIGFFPIRVQNIPEVIRTFFFSIILGGGHYFHNWFFLWNQGARADWPVFP